MLDLILIDSGNTNPFVASLVAAQKSDGGFWNFKKLGNEGCYLGVSLALDWRRGDGQLDRPVVQAGYPGAGGFRLYIKIEDYLVATLINQI